MKKFTKLLGIVLIMALVMSMGISAAFAAGEGSITIDNAIEGEEYTLYKIFDLTYGTGGTQNEVTVPEDDEQNVITGTYQPVSYTYTKGGDSDQFYAALAAATNMFTLTLVPGSTNVYSVVRVTGEGAANDAAVIQFMKDNISKLPTDRTIGTEEADESGEVSWEDLDFGYYYAASSAGALVTIDSTLPDATVKEKNSIPSQDKKQAIGTEAPSAATGYADDEQQVQVGDHVWYQIEITDGKGTDTEITLTDTLSNGLTNDKNVKVYLKSGEAAETEVAATSGETKTWAFEGTQTDAGFKIVFDADYVKTLSEGDKLYVRFSATVNTKAAEDIADGTDTVSKEDNTSKLDYSNQSSTDKVEVVTYKFQLDKSDKDYKDLLGAKFKLYRGSVADANLVKFTAGTAENSIPVLLVDPNGTVEEIDLTAAGLNSAKVIIKGLDKDTYVLRETKAPEGYNAAADQTVADTVLAAIDGTITDVVNTTEGDVSVVTVVNQQGTELPSTGGIGTTIFYVVGSILVVAAGVLLITKKRMSREG
jgi:fimbrial isopeptide formation D2 family protein/LPXTG-motif cell wall-anchored protein